MKRTMKARCIKDLFNDPHWFRVGEEYDFELEEVRSLTRRVDEPDKWGEWVSHTMYKVTCDDDMFSQMTGKVEHVRLSYVFFSRDYVTNYQPSQFCFDDYFEQSEPITMPSSGHFVPKQKKQLYPIAADKLEIYKRMRRETCAGLGDISEALREADGDYEKAKQIVIERNRGPKVLVNIKEENV